MEEKAAIARYVVRETLGVVVTAVALLWSEGSVDWWQGWVAIAIVLSWTVALAFVLLRLNPSLLAERLGLRKGAKSWDSAIVRMLGAAQLIRYVLAGLDHRSGWTVGFPLFVQIVALVVCVMGYGVFVWATASNAYFSRVIRIQGDRGQTVVKSGPYRRVRHPAYAGIMLCEVALAALLSPWWVLILGLLIVVLLIIRTTLEDRTLRKELPGYEEYKKEVRYRLIPGIW
jgi:protein-S-isoprenylcysteine O-methyltransferase Ste14